MPKQTVAARTALGLIIVSSVFSIVGMLLLRFSPAAVARAGVWLPWLMKVPTWIFMLALPWYALVSTVEYTGWRRGGLMLAWASLVGLGAELLGTTTGIPFGGYEYGTILGAKLFGHVPVSIPTSWYAAALMCAVLATRFTQKAATGVLVASLFMVLWDVTLDPAMSYGFPAWSWQVDGAFYGMPLSNFLGWFITSVPIMVVLVPIVLRSNIPLGWAVTLWLASQVLPVGISLVREMWFAAVVAVPAILIPIAPRLWVHRDREPAPARTPAVGPA